MQTRRNFLRKALYLTPVIMTVAVRPSYGCRIYGKPNRPGSGSGTNNPPPTNSLTSGLHRSSPPWFEFWRHF